MPLSMLLLRTEDVRRRHCVIAFVRLSAMKVNLFRDYRSVLLIYLFRCLYSGNRSVCVGGPLTINLFF